MHDKTGKVIVHHVQK